jgi:hypothetical protein
LQIEKHKLPFRLEINTKNNSDGVGVVCDSGIQMAAAIRRRQEGKAKQDRNMLLPVHVLLLLLRQS